jgi:DMSO/TMAO reductase YedYZ molybdopterin-dependent catalytic subunit
MKVARILVLALLLAACGAKTASQPESAPSLLVGDGATQKSYTQADLEKLPAAQAVFKDVAYKGVPLSELLKDAGFDALTIRAVKAVAADGYSMNYDPSVFQRGDVLVAYALADGPLTAEDESFRMVIPGAEGKLNVRMLIEVRAVP